MGSWRRVFVYALLGGAWLAVCLWQSIEHRRVSQAAYQALRHRAQDIATSLGIALRPHARPAGLVTGVAQAVLDDLVSSSEIVSVALLNHERDVVAAAGRPLDGAAYELAANEGIIKNDLLLSATSVPLPWRAQTETPRPAAREPPQAARGPRQGERPADGSAPRERRGQILRDFSPRPFWRTERLERLDELRRQQAMHWFVLALTTARAEEDAARDARLRLLVCGAALLAAAGLCCAWRGLERAAVLGVELVRSEQEKAFLEEKSVAAAGLAHETRNPLNVIRGLAQIVTQDQTVAETTRSHAAELMDQVDRVANRLREFLDYAKPLEAAPVATDIHALAAAVVDTLETDRQEGDIRCEIQGAPVPVLADPSLARQVIFNLVLNAYQAVPRGGHVCIAIGGDPTGRVELTVSDDGPGVPPAEREAVFRPYVSLHKKGTGLGLAVVRQICQAHGWRVACEASPLGGATFRITGIERATGA